MARLIEIAFFALIIFWGYRRVVAPFQHGFKERERERQAERQRENERRGWRDVTAYSRIDRASAKDAEFKDLQ